MSEWRYIASRLNGDGTETLLDLDVPLSDAEVVEELSRPGGLSGHITPELSRLRVDGRPMFEPWSTVIYAESSGVIRGGGILVDMTENGPKLTLDCVGFAGYPSGQPYTAEWSKKNIDPLDCVREIWRHLQSQPMGNLGMTVDATKSPVRVGIETKSSTSNSTSTNGNTGQVTSSSKTTETIVPYLLSWYETADLGKNISELVTETPFDYKVSHAWDGPTRIKHHLHLGYPEIRKRRDDLRFVVGENIFESPQIDYEGDQYASEVVVVGNGEGRKAIRGGDKKQAKRLRRAVVVNAPDLKSKASANARAKAELAARAGEVDITEVLQVDHPHAPIGSVNVGDDILIQTSDGWTDELSLWCRVLKITLEPEKGVALLSVTRTERARLE